MWAKLLLVGYVILNVSGANIDIGKAKPENSTIHIEPERSETMDKNSKTGNSLKRHADWYSVNEYEYVPEPVYYPEYAPVSYYQPYEPYHKPPSYPPKPKKPCTTTTTTTTTTVKPHKKHHYQTTPTPRPYVYEHYDHNDQDHYNDRYHTEQYDHYPTEQYEYYHTEYPLTSTPAPSGYPFSTDQLSALLETVRDTKDQEVQSAMGYLFPPSESRSEPSSCGCDEEIRQLQHAMLLLQESIRQLRNFIHADNGALFNENTKVVKISRKAVDEEDEPEDE